MEHDLHSNTAGWIGHDRTGDGFQEYVAETSNHPDGFGDGAHIALWHPDVALAVADWLDALAARHEAIVDNFAAGSRAAEVTANENVTAYAEALTVAHLLLRESQ